MAPSEEAYFPSLEKCFSGDAQLISWRDTYLHLCENRPAIPDDRYFSFLSCDDSIALLSRPTRGFLGPSSQAKSSFETKTAAINISPSPNGQYQIEEIKDDALWLAGEAKLDELAALRIAVLEWQQRPVAELQAGFSEAELASLKDSLGGVALGSVIHINNDFLDIQAGSAKSSFASADRRRQRLLKLYLGERESLLSASEKIISLVISVKISSEIGEAPAMNNANPRGRPTTYEELGLLVWDGQMLSIQQPAAEHYALFCIEAIQARIAGLEHGSGWAIAGDMNDDIEQAWIRTNIYEMVQILNLMLLNLRSVRHLAKSTVLLAWMRFVAKYDFFSRFRAQAEAQIGLIIQLQSSVALTTLAILDVSSSILYLLDNTSRPQSERDSEDLVYFLDLGHVSEIQEVFLSAASACIPSAGPAVFAWGMVLYTIRELALSAKETREGHQVQKAIDHAGLPDSPSGRRMSGSSASSSQQSIYEDIMDHVRAVSQPEDPVGYLMESAVDGSRVFDVVTALCESDSLGSLSETCWKRLILQDLISVAIEPLGYSPDILTSQLAILSYLNRPRSVILQSISLEVNDPRTAFVKDTFLTESIFNVAVSRFPYETLPFLKLCKHLAEADVFDEMGMQYITRRMRSMDTFTRVASAGFSAYHTIREDENANFVSLEQTIDMYGSADQGLLESSDNVNGSLQPYQISLGALGQVVSESKPTVIMWYHQYSALAFLGRWLELFQLGDEAAMISHSESPLLIAPEVINLIATMTCSTFNAGSSNLPKSQRMQNALGILEEASDLLDRNNDIVTIIFDIFEQELQGLRFRHSAERSLETILACAKFMLALIDVLPGRIWPLIARSSLLNVHGRDGILLNIVSSIEASSGNFDFLESCVHLFGALVEDTIRPAVSRGRDGTSSGHSESAVVASATAPTHVKEAVILSISQIMVEVFENSMNWKFGSPLQRSYIHTSILRVFGRIMKYVYGADDDQKASRKLTAALSESASYILENYRTNDIEVVSMTPLIQTIMEWVKRPDPMVHPELALASDDRFDATLCFCLSLVQVGRLLGHSASSLELQLFNAVPVLVRLFSSHESNRLAALTLMYELIDNVGLSQPQSLLGHLGSTSSRNLLNILSGLGKPFDSTPIFVAITRLATALVSNRQQWFAICILTGSSPQASLRGRSDGTSDNHEINLRGKSFLAAAMDYLSGVGNIEPSRAIAMLRFVIRAQENWAWAATSLDSHPQFFTALTSFVAKIDTKEALPLKQSYENQIAALVADLWTVYLHCAKSTADISIFRKLIPAINWFKSNAVDVSAYNASLHSNLRKNFSMKYPSCRLTNFKHTALLPSQFGENYFYDIYLATKMLSFDASWTGKGKNQDQGFLEEFKRANINLGLVQSQLTLLQSFRALSVEHSGYFGQDREVQKIMSEVVRNCLQANSRIYPAENIFESLFQTRIDFGVALLQRLVSIKPRGSDSVTLLPLVYQTMRFRNGTYEGAITNNDLTYYRSMLTALFLALQFHVEKRNSSQQASPPPTHGTKSNYVTESVVLEIMSSVIAQGFQSVTNALQDQKRSTSSHVAPEEAAVGTKDLSLLLSMLQSVLRLPLLPQMISQLSNVLISSDVIGCCLSLYSWSHVLASPNSNPAPIYADLSLRFLVSLSSFPVVAEELAIEGVLNRILTARITQILQSCSGGASPLDTRPHHQTLFIVWATGILPICLNLLHSVGRPMAGEIATFLNQFAQQLRRASNAFSYSTNSRDPASGAITLSLSSEAATLSLISHILESYRIAGASAGVDAIDIPSLDGYDQHKKALAEDIREAVGEKPSRLKERILATTEQELDWERAKAGNLLEMKIGAELRSAILCLAGGQEDED